MSLKVQLPQTFLINFGTISYFTEMALDCSKMDGFQIFKILLVAKIKDYHNLPKKTLGTLIIVD